MNTTLRMAEKFFLARAYQDFVYYPKGSKDGEKIEIEDGNVTPGGNWASFIAAVRAKIPAWPTAM